MIWIIGLGIAGFLFFAFPKQALVTVGVIGSICVLLVGYFYLSDEAKRQKASAVTVEAKFDPALCVDSKYPIFITTYNGSSDTVKSVSFTLSANRPGYSNDVYSTYHNSDKIVLPRTTFSTCWSLNDYGWRYDTNVKSPAGLVWRAERPSVEWVTK